VRLSSVVRALLASARLVGFGAALCAFVLWVVDFLGAARALDQDFGVTTGTLVQAALMAALALVAAWASFRPAPLVLVMISVISFVPVGFYLLLLSGYVRWIGICNLLCLAAGLLMVVCVRLTRAERREAVG
jgi:hypothetical protein